jgi:hypothetical protein
MSEGEDWEQSTGKINVFYLSLMLITSPHLSLSLSSIASSHL